MTDKQELVREHWHFEDVAGFLNAANGSGAGPATQLQEDLVTQAKCIYCCCPPPPELPSLSVADSEDGSARCISRALVISTAPSRAIPAPLVALWSSDKCSSPLPPDHLDRERAALRTDLGGRLQIWAAHIWSKPTDGFSTKLVAN